MPSTQPAGRRRYTDGSEVNTMRIQDEYARCVELARPWRRARPRRDAAAGLTLTDEHALVEHEPEWAELAEVPAFNALGYDGAGQVVAVLDSGVERATPALAENWGGGVSTIPGDTWLWHRGDRCDSFFHGTATAGVVAQAMPHARLLALKAFDQRPSTRLGARRNEVQWWVRAIDWLHRWQAKHEVRGVVVNISMGLTPARAPRGSASWIKAWADVRALEQAITRSVDEFGNVYCAAAANDGQRGSPPSYPAAFDGLVLAAGSLRLERHNGRLFVELSEFSNTNAYVDFVCPGEDVWTFLPTRTAAQFRRVYESAIASGAMRVERGRCGGVTQWLVELDGTSFASPALAALVAGVMQECKRQHDGHIPTTAEVRRTLVERSERFTDENGRTWLVPTLLASAGAAASSSGLLDGAKTEYE